MKVCCHLYDQDKDAAICGVPIGNNLFDTAIEADVFFGSFIEETPFPYMRCSDCEKHPDAPLLLLRTTL